MIKILFNVFKFNNNSDQDCSFHRLLYAYVAAVVVDSHLFGVQSQIDGDERNLAAALVAAADSHLFVDGEKRNLAAAAAVAAADSHLFVVE